MRIRVVVCTAWFLLIASIHPCSIWTVPTAAGQLPGQLTVGQPAPTFVAPTSAGHTVALQDYHGRPIILNFWATWCAPCRQEMAALQAIYAAHQATGLIVLGVSQDAPDMLETIRAYWTTLGLTFPSLLDPDGAIAQPYHVLLLPSTVFIDPSGRIAAVHLGPMTQTQIAQRLRVLLPEPG